MRLLLTFTLAVASALGQSPLVHLTNVSHPGSDFQIGDRFEIVIAGAASQPVSVRTTMHRRTDWGPIIAWTDNSGHWSTAGQFEKSDFGDWSEVWTVGGKLANPVVHFSVGAPCLRGGQGFAASTGCCTAVTCETAMGRQTFSTPSDPDSFRTPDGRLIPGRVRSNMTAEQYHGEIMQSLIVSRGSQMQSGQLGDEAAALITNIIGVNALSEEETRNVLSVIRTAFAKPDRIPQEAKDPSQTLLLLRKLADSADQEDLKREIAATMGFVQSSSVPMTARTGHLER
jgi:hypothetical protein